jgi:hypothetical protein
MEEDSDTVHTHTVHTPQVSARPVGRTLALFRPRLCRPLAVRSYNTSYLDTPLPYRVELCGVPPPALSLHRYRPLHVQVPAEPSPLVTGSLRLKSSPTRCVQGASVLYRTVRETPERPATEEDGPERGLPGSFRSATDHPRNLPQRRK